MRALPEGIRVERAGPPDIRRVTDLVEAGISGYREWAPDWTPPPPPTDRDERLAANFDHANDNAWVLMALDGDELVGVVSIAATTAAQKDPPPPGTVYLWQMFAKPAWQGTGLAQALSDLATDEALRRGFDRMVLWAAAGAAQARAFYEREGWTLSGETQGDNDFGLPLVQYERIIR
jgi:GNAT superfamily N-acetyltransferase